MRTGFTLFELVVSVALVLSFSSVAVPGLARHRDLAAVRSAREEIVAAFSEARLRAVARGEAVVQVVKSPPAVRVLVHDSLVREVDLSDLGTTIDLTAGRSEIELRYGPLGIGRFASASVLVRRGAVSAGVVVSSYGRVRRR